MINYRSGLNYTAAYQTSGIPFVTSSLSVTGSTPLRIEFNKITKFITVRNETLTSSANVPLRVGFSSNGVQGTNYISIDNKEVLGPYDWRAKEIYLYCPTGEATASISAGVTNIEGKELPFNWTGSVGVG
jgi:hypothetical protein